MHVVPENPVRVQVSFTEKPFPGCKRLRAKAASWFSHFLLNALVNLLIRRTCVRIVRLCRSEWLVQMRSSSGLPHTSRMSIISPGEYRAAAALPAWRHTTGRTGRSDLLPFSTGRSCQHNLPHTSEEPPVDFHSRLPAHATDLGGTVRRRTGSVERSGRYRDHPTGGRQALPAHFWAKTWQNTLTPQYLSAKMVFNR